MFKVVSQILSFALEKTSGIIMQNNMSTKGNGLEEIENLIRQTNRKGYLIGQFIDIRDGPSIISEST